MFDWLRKKTTRKSDDVAFLERIAAGGAFDCKVTVGPIPAGLTTITAGKITADKLTVQIDGVEYHLPKG